MPSPKSTKFAAFQFYPRDFLTSSKVARMSLAEVGIYITLLCYSWLDHGVPSNHAELAKMLRLPVPRFKKLWAGVLSECFVLKGGKFVNPRQEKQRKELQDYVASCQRGGERSAASRRARFGSAQPPKVPRSDLRSDGQVTPNTSSASSTASSSSSSEEHVQASADNDERLDIAFIAFQEAYPDGRKKGGYLLQRAFLDAAHAAGGAGRLMVALANHVASDQWSNPRLIPGMDVWLREERWRQTLPPAGAVTSSAANPKTAGNIPALQRFIDRGKSA